MILDVSVHGPWSETNSFWGPTVLIWVCTTLRAQRDAWHRNDHTSCPPTKSLERFETRSSGLLILKISKDLAEHGYAFRCKSYHPATALRDFTTAAPVLPICCLFQVRAQ